MAVLSLILIGLLGGLIGGLFGVGGGLVFVPLLILIRNADPHVAIGTSMAVIVPTALIASFRHASAGMIDWKSVLILALFSVVGAWCGAGLSLKLDVVLLKRLYAGLLLFIAFKLCFQN